MEACMVKPEVKKKPRPPKPPPKPPEIKRPDSGMVEKPTPVVPQRPTDAELTHTQYRMKRSSKEVKENLEQETIEKRKKTETPVVPPRPTEKELNDPKRYSYRKREKPEDTRTSRETDQSVQAEVPKDEADFKQVLQSKANPSVLTGMFWKSQKEKSPSFTSYVIDSNEEEKKDDTPAKQAPANKQGVLKGVMKGLQFKSSPKASREPSPDPSSVEPATEKEQSMEKNKQQKNAEPKQDIGGLLTGMFKKTHKEKTSSPVLTVRKADSDSEDAEEQTSEGSFSDLSARSKLSGSSDSLSANNKEKTGLFSGMFKKSPKTVEAAQTDEDQQSLHGDLSNSADNLCENSKDKGALFSGILRKSPKPPGEETPGQEKQQIEPSDRDENLSDNINKEKGGVFGIFKKSKPSEGSQLEEGEESFRGELSISTDNLLEKKEKGGLFSGLLKKTPKTPGEDNMPEKSSLSANNDSLSEAGNAKDRGGVFTGMFKKLSKLADDPPTEEEKQVTDVELSTGSDGLSEDKAKEKGGIFGGIFKKPPKPAEAAQTEEDDLNKELSTSNENLSEGSQEKAAIFGVRLKKTPKTSGEKTESPERDAQKELSASNEDLSESNTTKEKNIFSNLFKKPQKSPEDTAVDKELEENNDSQLSGSNENIVEATAPKEKKGGLAAIFKRSASIENVLDSEDKSIFSGMFKKPNKTSEGKPAEEDSNTGEDKVFLSSSENLSETASSKEKTGGLAGIFKKSKPAEAAETEEDDFEKELSSSRDNLSENKQEKNIFTNLFKKPHKSAGDAALDQELEKNNESLLSGSNENIDEATASKEKKGGLAGIFKRSASTENLLDSEDKNIFSGMFKKTNKSSEAKPADQDSNAGENKVLSSSCENLSVTTSKEKAGGLAGIFRKSPKPAPRSATTKDPLSDTKELYGSCDSIPDIGKEDLSGGEELSASTENLSETAKEKKTGFSGMFRRTPKTVEKQDSEDTEPLVGGGLRRRRTIKKKRRVVSFRVKKTLPRIPKLNLTSQSAEKMPKIEESVELQEMIPVQESTVELQNVEMAAYPTEGNPLDSEEENDGLLDWWNAVEGWAEWNESSNFQEEDEETAMEQAADRIYMAARLFVRLFNQRGASLQQRILELLALADAADHFHKKTVTAAVGGGVASVCGSVATITGLILAPFTFGASIIVTAVGIGVATAGSITSATANITDTVHSNMDRKKVEKMIQGYQEEIKDIRECLEFVQEGMDTLQELDFDKYSQSAAKKALNHNIKHVMKEGGRAGKALMINTDKLISTVQVLGAAGGAAKAAQAISVTTGVMSALFLALDVFFLAKDSHELRKGAKTKFATKIREVCKDLQDGLLELNKVKTQLQKTMDGIELEEYEEIEEVEVEVDDDLESDPVKLAELEQELDLMEEKLDRKVEEERKRIEEEEKKKAEEERKRIEEEEKNEEAEKANKKGTERSVKDKGESEEKTDEEEEKEGELGGNDVKKEGGNDSQKEESEKESKAESKSEKLSDEEKQQNILTGKAAKEEVLKEQSHKGTKKDKEMENQITAGKEKYEQGNVPNKKTGDKKEEGNKTGKEQLGSKSHSGGSNYVEWTKTVSSEKVKSERETSKSSREDERGTRGKPELKPEKKEEELGSKRRDSSRSDKEKASDRSQRWSKHEPRAEEERGVRDWRAEMTNRKEEARESKEGREPKRETERSKGSHRSHEAPTRREHSDRERRSSREESDAKRSHSRRGHEERGSGVKEEEERGERRSSRQESDAKRSHSRRGHEERGSGVKEEEEERGERRSSREESDAKRSHSRRGHEERGSGVKEEEERGERRRSHRERRESDRDRGHGHSRRGSRPRSNALLEDGLYI